MSAVATAASPREMWRGLWPERAIEAVPIIHVTNGVHLPSWVGLRCTGCSTATSVRTGGGGRVRSRPGRRLIRSPTPSCGARCEQRAELVALVKERSGMIGSPSISHARRSRRLRARLIRTC